MNIDNWLAFVLAYSVISLIPGPSVMMVIGQALSFGRRAAFICILGDLLGGVLLIVMALLGVGYMAFLAQFMDASQPVTVQFAVLLPTATVIVTAVLGGYALLASQASRALQSPAARKRSGVAGGGLLLGGSAVLAWRG